MAALALNRREGPYPRILVSTPENCNADAVLACSAALQRCLLGWITADGSVRGRRRDIAGSFAAACGLFFKAVLH
ncbi:hypothetical protein PC116_g20611 [Phytophthora cactorum]|uniref:Uncharacterized protein n=1 Tax=Phytophthora cactorum TaxID=29920 RepID=A0A8T1DBC7_9STRA|nr:hypothetical protein PC117_g11812 [Phytophthora cactorum]KAG4053654.1 hypothetical protein PC123_g11188 [Phytophthora cactorum]KAG4231116.1 hypothetical protein PC116_g20611 [Phytophthora cactorum]